MMLNKVLLLTALSLCTTLEAIADQQPAFGNQNIPSAASPTISTSHKSQRQSTSHTTAAAAYASVINGSGIPGSSNRVDNSPVNNIHVPAPQLYTLQTRSIPSQGAVRVYINDVPREYYIPRERIQVIEEPVYYIQNEYTHHPHHHHYHYHYQYHWAHRAGMPPHNIVFYQY